MSSPNYAAPVNPGQRQEAKRDSHFARLLVAWVALALAVLLTAPAVFARWVHDTVGDKAAYVAAVAPVATDPVAQKVVADQVSEAVVKQLGVGSTFEAAIGQAVAGLAVKAMGTAAFVNAWNEGNAAVQQEIVGTLGGQASGVTVAGDDVILDLSGVLNAIKDDLIGQSLGIATNLAVPAGAVQVRLMDAATLHSLQLFYRISQPIGGWLIYFVAALYLLAILVAPRRGPILMLGGLAVAGSGLLLMGVVVLGESAFRAQLVGQPFEPAAAIYFRALASPLAGAISIMTFGGLAAAVLGALWWVLERRRPQRARS